jgi:hypothetical protein
MAACSGSFGSGSNSPIPLGSLGPSGPATPTPPSTSSTVVLTYGDNDGFQNLPEVGGYAGSIAFPKAPPPTVPPSPKPAKGGGSPSPAPAPTAVSIAVGATLFVSKPDEGPDLNFAGGKGKSRSSRAHPARALAYIKLLPTHDITLETYPRFVIDIPRDLASQYRDGEFGLALWNSGEKDANYRLAVAERDASSSPPPIVRASAAPIPTVPPSGAGTGTVTATIGPAPSPSAPAGRLSFGSAQSGASAGPSGSAGVAPAMASATLPPQRLLFAGTVTTLHLVANRPAIFALYALPNPSQTAPPSPAPSRAAAAHSAPSPLVSPAAASVPSASSVPAASSPPSPAPAHS